MSKQSMDNSVEESGSLAKCVQQNVTLVWSNNGDLDQHTLIY